MTPYVGQLQRLRTIMAMLSIEVFLDVKDEELLADHVDPGTCLGYFFRSNAF